MAMSEEQAKEKAQFRVFVDMNRGDFEEGGRKWRARGRSSREDITIKMQKAIPANITPASHASTRAAKTRRALPGALIGVSIATLSGWIIFRIKWIRC